jgi:phage terminase large subunit GpA-like protein
MLSAGRWVAEKPAIKHHRGYHINALYAPTGLGLNWLKVAQKWIDVQGDRAELKSFVNTYLGQVWKEEGDSVEPHSLITRLEPYQAQGRAVLLQRGGAEVLLPLRLITAGVDVQKDRLEATIVGWADGEEAWVLDHIILPGDTAQPHVWADLLEALQAAGVQRACVDAGYNTTMVQTFCTGRGWATPTKGIPGSHRPLVEDDRRRKQRLRVRRKRGLPIEPLGVDQGKALIYARLKLPAPGPGYIHWPQHPAFDDEYFAQVAAEKLVVKYRGHRPSHEWVQTRPRNEGLDCLLLALAALRLSGLRLARPVQGKAGQPAAQQPDDQADSSQADDPAHDLPPDVPAQPVPAQKVADQPRPAADTTPANQPEPTLDDYMRRINHLRHRRR